MFGCLYRSDLVRLVKFFVKSYIHTHARTKKIFISTLLVVLAASVRTGQACLCEIWTEGFLSHVKVDWNVFKASYDALWNFQVDSTLHNLKWILLTIFATLWSIWGVFLRLWELGCFFFLESSVCLLAVKHFLSKKKAPEIAKKNITEVLHTFLSVTFRVRPTIFLVLCWVCFIDFTDW